MLRQYIGEGGIGELNQILTVDITAADGITLEGDIITSNGGENANVTLTGKTFISERNY